VIVVDASILANALADDRMDGRRARAELRQARNVSTPDLADVETVAVLRKRWLAKSLTAHRFAIAVEDLQALDVQRFPALPLVRRAYELRANVTPYDAVYVALAEALGCELVTADARLAKAAGPRCAIRVPDRPR
jgi:predicted nucleic acid-binding protein